MSDQQVMGARPKLVRWAAFFAYYLFARHLPITTFPFGRTAQRIRRACVRPLFRSCGRDVNVEHGADFAWGDRITIGDRSGIGIDSFIRADLTIGRDVMMGPQVMIYGRDHVATRGDVPMMDQGMDEYEPIVVGDNVWIGARVIILKGVTIGEGTIVGAGSVVVNSLPAQAVCVGNPARVVRSR